MLLLKLMLGVGLMIPGMRYLKYRSTYNKQYQGVLPIFAMPSLNEIKVLLKKYKQEDYKLSDIRHYVVGTIRIRWYFCYPYLIRYHIYDQIRFRLEVLADKECVNGTRCKACTCTTPDLFAANKACKLGCYPKFYSGRIWKRLTSNYTSYKFLEYTNKK